MRYVPLMISLLLLAGCETVVMKRAVYEKNPERRTVTVDGAKIHVVQQMGSGYVAWGGGKQSDRWVRYKQKRAIELVSGCQVREVVSKKTDDVTYGFVECD